MGGLNPYTYLLNPLQKVDPSGQEGTRSDGHPWGYGCGDAGTDRFIPDSFGAAKFLQACGEHDSCYGTLGSNKAICDKEFGANLDLACKNDLTGLHLLYRPVCHGVAGGYEFAVTHFGDAAFTSAQEIAASNIQELEMLDLLHYDGINVDPDYYNEIYQKVVSPR